MDKFIDVMVALILVFALLGCISVLTTVWNENTNRVKVEYDCRVISADTPQAIKDECEKRLSK